VRARQIRKRRRNWESRSNRGRRANGAGSSCRYVIREVDLQSEPRLINAILVVATEARRKAVLPAILKHA
jgi:hypothetical protein